MKTLFKNAHILKRNRNGKYTILENTDLLIDNKKIEKIAKNIVVDKNTKIIDMTDHLLMPGLINAHGHSPMTILRGMGSGQKLQDWLNKTIFPIESYLNPTDVYHGAMLAAVEMIRSGTTSFSEMYDFPYSSMLAIAKSGLKGNVCRTGLCFDPNIKMSDWVRFEECLDIVRFTNKTIKTNLEQIREVPLKKDLALIYKAIDEGRILGDISLHSVYLTTDTFVKEMTKANAKLNARVQIHVSENSSEVQDCKKQKNGLTPVQYFHKFGAFKNAYCAHLVAIDDNDLDILKKDKVVMVHNPSSNAKLGSGIAPVSKAIKKGICVALGTDGCASNNNLDMFEEMHLTAMLQTASNHDCLSILPDQIIDMATINGAKALGRGDTGKLEVGYKADIIAIDLNSPNMNPHNDIVASLVYSVNSRDVTMNMVDGKILYKDGKFYTLNANNIINNAKITFDDVMKRMNK